MATQLLIKRGSTPLSDARVEFDDTHEACTDANGLVHLDLQPGPHTLRLQVDGNTLEVPFRLDSDGEIHVLDIDELLEEAMRETAGLPDDVPVEVAERYRVQQVLGRGGMGIVVRAWDTLLERQVAIKFLNDKMASHDEAQDIFLKEARSLARLRHDCLVDVHDVSVDHGQPIMVTEFVEGENLASVLSERGRLNSDQVLSLAASVCEGLAHMHDHGLIHRDIKPANIILQPDGHLKLIDFGLARSLEHLVSQGTQVRGTPAYMAPEQVKGEELGPATDIYQLGVTLFELATATIPFPEDPYGLAHVEKSVPSLESRGIEPDPRLTSLIEACLQKDPEERPADASVILEHLRAAPEPSPADATPGTSGLQPSIPPWAITATSTVAVVGLAVLGWIYLLEDDGESAHPEPLRDAAPQIRPKTSSPSATATPQGGEVIEMARSSVSDAVGEAIAEAENADGPADDPAEATTDEVQPAPTPGGSANGTDEDSATGAPERPRGTRNPDQSNPEPGEHVDQQAEERAAETAPTQPDTGQTDESTSETTPETSASTQREKRAAENKEASQDAGTVQAEEQPATPAQQPDDDSEDDSNEKPEDDSSEENPPNPRFF